MRLTCRAATFGLVAAALGFLGNNSQAAPSATFKERFDRFRLELPKGYRPVSKPPRTKTEEALYQYKRKDAPDVLLFFEPGVSDLSKCGATMEEAVKTAVMNLAPAETNLVSRVYGNPAKLTLFTGYGENKSVGLTVRVDMYVLLGSVVVKDGAVTFYAVYPKTQRSPWEDNLKEAFSTIRNPRDRKETASKSRDRNTRQEPDVRSAAAASVTALTGSSVAPPAAPTAPTPERAPTAPAVPAAATAPTTATAQTTEVTPAAATAQATVTTQVTVTTPAVVAAPTTAPTPATGTAKVVFYRTGKLSGASSKFIIGNPDMTIVKLKNKSYFEYKVDEFREWEFAAGIFKISASVKLDIKPGATHYIRCLVKEGFPAITAEFEVTDEAEALRDIAKLNRQTDI